jgi:hypothetical protein
MVPIINSIAQQVLQKVQKFTVRQLGANAGAEVSAIDKPRRIRNAVSSQEESKSGAMARAKSTPIVLGKVSCHACE